LLQSCFRFLLFFPVFFVPDDRSAKGRSQRDVSRYLPVLARQRNIAE